MRILYSLSIFFYGIGIRIASIFNVKAKYWIDGRKNLFVELEKKMGGDRKKMAWFHCASLGEFEQGRPLMEQFKKENPDYKILLTFFSPSGYEVRKNYAGAEIVTYLPLDTKRNAKRFMEIAKPDLAFFVKYEFWLNFLEELKRKNIPHFLVSAIFRSDQIFFKMHGQLFRNALKDYSWIFTQEKESEKLLKSIGIDSVEVAGDTRFDRVVEISEGAKEITIAKVFSGENKKTVVAGSTWRVDEEKLFPAIVPLLLEGWKLIIAPHELSGNHLAEIESDLKKNGVSGNKIVRFSNAGEDSIGDAKILVVDNIGMLSSLYQYGKIAYVGGGFGKSIHNILEAAVYGMPVIFGPRFEKFQEAKEMIETGSGIGVKDENELRRIFKKVAFDREVLDLLAFKSRKFVYENTGATKRILDKVKSFP